jgi:glycosyltransferase involved in cell wall biosynthesis
MPSAAKSSAAVSLVMPCFNEEACLGQTARDLLDAFDRASVPLELVLVDNGSRDRTGFIIDELIALGRPVVKVTVPVNMGYGNGVIEGLKACTAPFVGYTCADGQLAAEEAVRTYREAQSAGVPAMAKVRRRFRKDSWRRKLVSILYNFGMQFVFGWLGSIDLNASPKVFPREALASMQLKSKDWFLDPELMIKAKHVGLKILERDAEGLPRAGGKSNVRYSTCLQFMKNIARYRFGGEFRAWKRSVQRLDRSDVRPAAAPQPEGRPPR